MSLKRTGPPQGRHQWGVQGERGHALTTEQDVQFVEEAGYPATVGQMPKSIVRYRSAPRKTEGLPPPPVRRASVGLAQKGPRSRERTARPLSWRFLLVLGMCLALLLAIGLSTAQSWWQGRQDEVHYGTPRTYQADWVVGHQDDGTHPTHFIALNLSGKIHVIEFPGGGPAVRDYEGPQVNGPDRNAVVVTLSFRDVNGDGKVDMIVETSLGVQVPFLNDGTKFRPVQPGDHIKL